MVQRRAILRFYAPNNTCRNSAQDTHLGAAIIEAATLAVGQLYEAAHVMTRRGL